MMQQLQQQYAFVRPKRSSTPSREGKLPERPARRTPTGAIADSRLHVVYENGTEVYVNRSAAGPWTVKDHHGATVELPVVRLAGLSTPANGFYEISANAGGRRID